MMGVSLAGLDSLSQWVLRGVQEVTVCSLQVTASSLQVTASSLQGSEVEVRRTVVTAVKSNAAPGLRR